MFSERLYSGYNQLFLLFVCIIGTQRISVSFANILEDRAVRPFCKTGRNLEAVDSINTTFLIKINEGSGSFECFANYPMDFNLDGLPPAGKEIEIVFDNTINGDKVMHWVSVTLLTDTKNLRLSGRYNIFSVDDPSIQTSIYIFQDGNPYLFSTKQTKEIYVDPSFETLTIPCRLSSPELDVVELYRKEEKNEELIGPSQFITYNPKSGFTWDIVGLPIPSRNELTKQWYLCRTKYHTIEWELTDIDSENETNKTGDKVDINNGSEHFSLDVFVDQGEIRLSCLASGTAYLSNIQARNPRELSLRDACKLEETLCSWKRVGGDSLRGHRPGLKPAFSQGLAFCQQRGQHINMNSTISKIYFLGLNDQIYFNWKNAFGATNALLRIIPQNVSNIAYSNITYTFLCAYARFIMNRPILFTLHFKNGTSQEYGRGSTWLNQRNSPYSASFTLFSNISQVSCSSYPWNSSLRINSSVDVKLRDKSLPTVDLKVAKETLVLKTKNAQIKCVVSGDEVPVLSWEKDGEKLNSSDFAEIDNRPGYSFINFPIVGQEHSGEYKCTGKNSIGSATKTFVVNVVENSPELTISYWILVGIPVGLLVVLILTIVISCRLFKYFYGKQIYLSDEEILEFKNGTGTTTTTKDEKSYVNNIIENVQGGPYNQDYEIPESQFQLDRSAVLGSGQYGVVYKGLFNHEPVAIKSVKPYAEKTYVKALLSELKVMIFINGNKNIVNLIGANTENLKKGNVYVFVELCQLGSLESYLRTHRTNFVNQITNGGMVDALPRNYVNVDNGSDTLFSIDLIRWTLQISNAMEYLTEKKVIHGDLATRNVLLSNRETAKITDFGLARKLYDYAVYEKKKQEPLPWRWMAIESLRALEFSTKSDVWSFGVTLWEIYSLGDIPYPGLCWSIDFVDQLQKNLRMSQPRNASLGIYNTMLECWRNNPEDRPSFESISKYFSEYFLKFGPSSPAK